MVALLAVGTGCGVNSHSEASKGRAAADTEGSAKTGAAARGEAQVVAPALGAKPKREEVVGRGTSGGPPTTTPPPPIPALANQPPQVPPNTVTLDALHRQGRTHVLR